MKEKILLIWKHLKQGTLKKMWKQTLWIYQYGRRFSFFEILPRIVS